jgi:hypothetical protein
MLTRATAGNLSAIKYWGMFRVLCEPFPDSLEVFEGREGLGGLVKEKLRQSVHKSTTSNGESS